ncbi:YihY/virulence factor BrkB family protein [Haloarchaeobius sp. HME9146]|uniref:YihY/virulence factor BrkB family protein n=1 Tax=Haloarchaeobius sp. HME9146 TaxID=2978732 RepID=UPI0021C17541|nr:YihY/virulence factor BrkB family protein [Haloarchaeobius sp. HME9146]MCT9095485.1 YihY/virulence factor BrkB family protein [Haloarchaeobius sp. HME9146]
MSRLASAKEFVTTVVDEIRAKNVTFLAGGIAYNAFVSMVPLFLFAVFALSLIGGGVRNQVLTLLTQTVSETIGTLVEEILRRRADGGMGSSVVGSLILVWGALKVFRGLDTAFAQIYEVDADTSFLDQLRDGLVVLVSLVLSIAALVAATSAFAAFAGVVPYLGVFLPVVLAAGLVLAFFPMYYVFPDADVTVREVLPGVLFAAVGWALLQGLFQVYVAASTGDQAVGIFTGIMLLLTWLYFSGVVMLVGVVINAVRGGYAGRGRSVGS